MRFFYSFCGLVALIAGSLSLWLNVYGGYTQTAWLCEAGFCDAELLKGSARVMAVAGPAGSSDSARRLEEAILKADAASPWAWSNAAFAYANSGDKTKARYCAERALELGSGSAPLLMRVLNFYVGEGFQEGALRTGKALLARVRDYDEFVFRYYDALETTAGAALDHGLPADPEAAAAYLRYRTASGDVAGAAETWRWMQSRSLITEPAVNSYAAFLLEHELVAASREIWDEFHAKGRASHRENLIFNPDFETPFSKGPYDWKMHEIAGATVGVGRAGPEGRGALRIDFQGEANIDFQHVAQIVPVSRRPLRLKAMVKCDGLTTNEGVAICVFDRELPTRFFFTTEQLTRTVDWKQWDYALAVPAATRLLELRIVRRRSNKFDSKIKGTAWFSEISLEGAL